MEKKPIIIFDTDMDTDCDDAGALLLLVNAHLKQEIELLGVVADSKCECAAPFCKSVLDYYSLDIPVGEVYGYVDDSQSFDAYHKHQLACAPLAYNKILSKRNGSFSSSSFLYHKLLSEASDNSVTILCVGMLTALHEALKADCDLFARKVKAIVVMGNPYKQKDFNFSMDAQATKGFFEKCPCPVFISYSGGGIITGNYLNERLPNTHPVRQAYQIWSGGKGRSSWDLIAALVAMKPSSDLFKEIEAGALEYDEVEKITTITDKGISHKIIGLCCNDKEMEEIINDLLR